jgi:hypothetical protein
MTLSNANERLDAALTRFDAACDRLETFYLTQVVDEKTEAKIPWFIPNVYAKSILHGAARALIGTIQIVASPILGLVGVLLSPIFGMKIINFAGKHFCHGFANVFRAVGEILPGIHYLFVSRLEKIETKTFKDQSTMNCRELYNTRELRYSNQLEKEDTVNVAGKRLRVANALPPSHVTLLTPELKPSDPNAHWSIQPLRHVVEASLPVSASS